jgi:hypothetical protein
MMISATKTVTEEEKNDLNGTAIHLTERCLRLVEAITQVVLSQGLQMSDTERLERFYGLRKELSRMSRITHQFSDDVRTLIGQRLQGTVEMQQLKKLFNN